MSKPHPGRPRAKSFAATQHRIARLKASLNPATGQLWTYREIGQTLTPKISGQAVFHYLKDSGGCPCCKQKLKKGK